MFSINKSKRIFVLVFMLLFSIACSGSSKITSSNQVERAVETSDTDEAADAEDNGEDFSAEALDDLEINNNDSRNIPDQDGTSIIIQGRIAKNTPSPSHTSRSITKEQIDAEPDRASITPKPTQNPTPTPAAPQVKVEGVPMILQFPELPTGCEETSAAMALRFLGVNVDKITISNEISKSPLPEKIGDNLVADSPNNTFIGSPFSDTGYGVYHTPVFNLMSKYTSNIKDITGSSFDTLKNYIDQGKPVVIWASVNMQKVESGTGWYVNGQLFQWKRHEHCLVLVGYTETQVIVNDPLRGVVNYSTSFFVNAYTAMGKQAIVVYKQ